MTIANLEPPIILVIRHQEQKSCFFFVDPGQPGSTHLTHDPITWPSRWPDRVSKLCLILSHTPSSTYTVLVFVLSLKRESNGGGSSSVPHHHMDRLKSVFFIFFVIFLSIYLLLVYFYLYYQNYTNLLNPLKLMSRSWFFPSLRTLMKRWSALRSYVSRKDKCNCLLLPWKFRRCILRTKTHGFWRPTIFCLNYYFQYPGFSPAIRILGLTGRLLRFYCSGRARVHQDERLWERLSSRYMNKSLKTLVELHVSDPISCSDAVC